MLRRRFSPIFQNVEMNKNSIETQIKNSLCLSLSLFSDKSLFDDDDDERTRIWTKQDFCFRFSLQKKTTKNYKSKNFTRGKLVYSKQVRVYQQKFKKIFFKKSFFFSEIEKNVWNKTSTFASTWKLWRPGRGRRNSSGNNSIDSLDL